MAIRSPGIQPNYSSTHGPSTEILSHVLPRTMIAANLNKHGRLASHLRFH